MVLPSALVLRNPIANPRLGENDKWVVGVFLNLLPKLPDIDAKILRVLCMCRSPDRG